MRIIAIEEHFITPMYREKVAANEFRNFYLSSRSQAMGHDIIAENLDLGASRIAHMDAAGVDVQVLSFGSPGPQAFPADVAIPMARDANDRLFQAIQAHPTRFAGFAALPTADPEKAAQELERFRTLAAEVQDNQTLLLYVEGPSDPPAFYEYRLAQKAIQLIGHTNLALDDLLLNDNDDNGDSLSVLAVTGVTTIAIAIPTSRAV